MLQNITNFFNLIRGRKIKTTPDGSDLIPLGTRDPRYDGFYQPTGITVDDFVASLPAGVQSVTAAPSPSPGGDGIFVNNTDPLNPVLSFTGVQVDGTTITGTGVFGDPLVAVGGGAVNYANVIFVDSTNGNDGTAVINDFTKPMATIAGAITLASGLSSDFVDRALIYIRKGLYFLSGTNTLYDYVDFYSEVGVVIQGGFGRLSDQFAPGPVNVNFMGYADIVNCDLYITKASTVNVQVNSMTNINALFLIIPASGTANVTIEANKLYSQGNGTSYGITIRNSSNVTVNIKEKYSALYSLFDVRNHSGRIVVNAPKLALADGNPYGYGGNFKQVVIIRANLGGEMIINGDLVNEDTVYYGGISAMITRFQDSWGTLRVNGNIYSGDTFGINAQGSSAASRTIVNGDIRTNHLCAYVGNSSQLIVRNGTLMNWNTYSAALLYPVLALGGTASGLYVENCTMYSLGTGGAGGINKDTQASTLVVNNVLYSGADTVGFFVINTLAGQPVNNARFNNVRSSKPLDTNITDLLSPTGFILDANTLAPNFI
jgi:hypothetical protein